MRFTGVGVGTGTTAPLDAVAMAAARAHLDGLAKPPGSLGRLEELVVTLAGITGDPFAPVSNRAIVVAAADHGVARHGVSAWPSEVTAQMVANFLAGGAAISSLASVADARLVIVDAGVGTPIPPIDDSAPGVTLVRRPVRRGTEDLSERDAMSHADAAAAIEVGLDVVRHLVADGVNVVGIGEMGIGNSTAAAAIVAAMTGRPAAEVTGRGTGVNDAGWARKVRVVDRALRRQGGSGADPLATLAALGGLEVGALVGVILAAAAARVPVVLDGFITGAAALVAAAIEPAVVPRLIASHCSTEPGHAVTLDRLGLRPLLELDLRLGEGTGAALAMLLLDAAVAMRDGMASFTDAGVAGALNPGP